jgi:hypothetical protein
MEPARALALLGPVCQAIVGQSQQALWSLEGAARLEHYQRLHVRANPIWDPIRGDPRFAALVGQWSAPDLSRRP